MNFDVSVITTYWQLILSGIPIILILSLVSALLGTVIGLLSVLLRKSSKLGDMIVSVYVDIFRGTPVYVQLFFFYFGIPSFLGINVNAWTACIVALSLNSGSYLSEIIRAGIEAIDKGQIEAAKALGVKSIDITKDIIVPQAFRNVLPAIVNEFITLTKETAVVSAVGMHDMMYWFTAVKSLTYRSFEPLLVIFIAYYVMNKVLSLLGKAIERRLQYD